MGDIFVQLVDMPEEFRGCVGLNPDGSYTIFINARLDYATQRRVYMHELQHIENEDFDKLIADDIEYEAHRKENSH